jgi:uncharacterized protein YjbI with pentapeptide repeats
MSQIVFSSKQNGLSIQQTLNAGATLSDFRFTLLRIWYRDTYGDTWNNGSISFIENLTKLNLITLNGPPSNTKNWFYIDVTFKNNINYDVTKINGGYPTEILFAITTPSISSYLNISNSITNSTSSTVLAETSNITTFSVPSSYYYSTSELKTAGFTLAEFITAGFTGSELKTAGFTLAEFITAGFTLAEFKTAGFTGSELKPAGFRLAELKTAGFTASQLSDGFTLSELKTAGFTLAEFITAGFTASQLKTAGFTLSELKTDFTATELKLAGFTLEELFTNTGRNLYNYFIDGPNQLLGFNNFTYQQNDHCYAYLTTNLGGNILRILGSNIIMTVLADGTNSVGSRSWFGAVGVTKLPFKATGYTFHDITNTTNSTWLRGENNNNPNDVPPVETTSSPLVSHSSNDYNNAIFNVDSEILDLFKTTKVIRFFVDSYVDNSVDWGMVEMTAPLLKANGFTATDLITAGFTASELKTAGFTLAEFITAGFTLAEFKTAGFTLAEFITAGFTLAELKTAGFTGSELKTAEFTASELKTAGFTLAELFNSGVNTMELLSIGFDISRMEVNDGKQFFEVLTNPITTNIILKENITLNNEYKLLSTNTKIITSYDKYINITYN